MCSLSLCSSLKHCSKLSYALLPEYVNPALVSRLTNQPVIQAAKEDHHPHSSWIRRTTPASVVYTGQGQREAEPRKRQGERGGWRFEELLFGGRMIQLAPFTPSEPDWFLVSHKT